MSEGSINFNCSPHSSLLRLAKGEAGVTGLETAIILIAFVVVASVFAFTVLSTGLFSAERGEDVVHSGLRQARGGVQLQGAIVANGVLSEELSDGDTAWTDLTNVTATVDTSDKKEGTASGELAVASGKTGLLAYENISPTLDLTNHDSIRIYLQSDVASTAGQITLVIDDTNGCSSPLERISLPKLTASTWKTVEIGMLAATTRTAVACVGLYIESSFSSAVTLNFDDVVVRGQVTTVTSTVSNTIDGVALDVTQPSDSDNDGFADTIDTQHSIILSYTDANQRKNDIYWTTSFIGFDDGDDLLEEGERMEITIYLNSLDQATPLTRDTNFAVEIRPKGSIILQFQRDTPSKIDLMMNLN